MRHIEPDLMTNVIPTHAENYKNETQEQRVARMQSYDKAFTIFDKVADEYEKEFHQDVVDLKKKSRTKAMRAEKRERKKDLKTIEEQLDQG